MIVEPLAPRSVTLQRQERGGTHALLAAGHAWVLDGGRSTGWIASCDRATVRPHEEITESRDRARRCATAEVN